MDDIKKGEEPKEQSGLLYIMLKEYGVEENDVARIFADFIATNEAVRDITQHFYDHAKLLSIG